MIIMMWWRWFGGGRDDRLMMMKMIMINHLSPSLNFSSCKDLFTQSKQNPRKKTNEFEKLSWSTVKWVDPGLERAFTNYASCQNRPRSQRHSFIQQTARMKKKNVLSLLEPRLTFNCIISWLNGASVVCNVWHILGDVVGTVICVVFGTVICVVFGNVICVVFGTEVGVVVGTAVVVCCTNFAGHLVNLGGWYGHSGPSTVAMGRKTLFLKYPT